MAPTQFSNETSCWQRLDIAPTQDLKAIRRAYTRQIKIFQPEDHPEEFAQIRKAFEAARIEAQNAAHSPDLEAETDEGASTPIQSELPRMDELPLALKDQICQALADEDPLVAIETLEQLINDPSQPLITDQLVHQLVMHETLAKRVPKASLAQIGWRWFYFDQKFIFNFHADHDALRGFAEILFIAITQPIQKVIDDANTAIESGNEAAVVRIVAEALDNSSFDHLDARRRLRLELMRFVAHQHDLCSDQLIMDLDDLLQWREIQHVQQQEDWSLVMALEQRLNQAESKPKAPKKPPAQTSKEEKPDAKFTRTFLFYFLLILFTSIVIQNGIQMLLTNHADDAPKSQPLDPDSQGTPI